MVQLSNQNTHTSLSKSFVLWQAEDLSDALTSQTADLRSDWRNELPVLVIHEAHKLSEISVRSLRLLPLVLIELSNNCDASSNVDLIAHSEEELNTLIERIALNPVASVTCCQVLRHSENVSTDLGLLLESVAYGTLQNGNEFEKWLDGRGRRVRPEEASPPILVNAGVENVELQLNRPKLKNAFSASMRDSLVEALRGLATEVTVGQF